ncbi:hypothetical protein WMY93_012519 [Mugilogobius chulae]|uniref:SRCR domain-containing protein n=1 Tax=Mugilogobius chulae TaxID=88201 RepID=A0AAW0PBT9_9GOBI
MHPSCYLSVPTHLLLLPSLSTHLLLLLLSLHTSPPALLSPHTPPLPSLILCLCLTDSVRLSGGPGRCSGSLEVLVDQMWSSVCAEDFGQTEAEVVCRELDCGGVSELQRALFTEGSAVGRSFHCNGAETALKDCESSETRCSAAANITCTDSVRLSGGPGRCSGSLEVLVDQMWSSVCAEDFGQTEAEVVCRELDCRGVSELQRALFTEGSAVGRSFHCNGAETALKDCESSETHCSAAANITCTDQWRDVKPIDRDVDLDFGSVLCQQLGCGLALRVSYKEGLEPFWWLDPECVKQRAGLRHCLVHDENNTQDTDSIRLMCSAVNHSAHFKFAAFGPAHSGNYTCGYEDSWLKINIKDVSLHISLGVSDSDLILRAVIHHVLILLITTTALCFYCQRSSSEDDEDDRRQAVETCHYSRPLFSRFAQPCCLHMPLSSCSDTGRGISMERVR